MASYLGLQLLSGLERASSHRRQVTRDEAERLRQQVKRVAGKWRIQLPPPMEQRIDDKSFAGEKDAGVVLTRDTIRLFGALYVLTNVYENLLVGLLRRKRWHLFIKDLALRSSAGFAGFIAVYSLLFRLLRPLFLSQLARVAAIFRHWTHPEARKPGSLRPRVRATALRMLQSQSLAVGLAGALASPALLLDNSGTRRVTVALYTLSKMIESSWTAAGTAGWLPRQLKKTSWWFGPHLIFALSNAQLLHAFVYDPNCFPDSYSKFILRFSDAYLPRRPSELLVAAAWPEPRQLIDVIAQTSTSKRPYPRFESALLRPGAKFAHTATTARVQPILDYAHPLHNRFVCATLHPEEPMCAKVATTFARREFLRATRFMAILSAVRLLISWRRTKADPLIALTKATQFSVGSGAAIAGCIGVAWSSICFFQTYLPNNVLPTRRFYLQGFLAGLCILLSPARSAELGMYSARLALGSAWQVAVKRGRVRSILYGELVPFAFAASILMVLHERGPSGSIKGMTKRILDRAAPVEKQVGAEEKVP